MIEIARIEDLPLPVAKAVEDLRKALLTETTWVGAQITLDNLRDQNGSFTPNRTWTLDVKHIVPGEPEVFSE